MKAWIKGGLIGTIFSIPLIYVLGDLFSTPFFGGHGDWSFYFLNPFGWMILLPIVVGSIAIFFGIGSLVGFIIGRFTKK